MNKQPVPEITPAELLQTLERGDRLQIIDIRGRSAGATPTAGMLPDDRLINIAGSTLLRISNLEGTGIDPATPTVVICAHGNDSKIVALHLNRLGATARSLRGGMAAYMMLSVPRELPSPPSLDRLVQLDRVGKEALSYAFMSAGEAFLIDPPRDYSTHLQVIDREGATLVGVADTHVHADYISGAPLLARERRVPYYLHPADSIYPYDETPGRLDFHPLSDGMSIRVGRSALSVLHTPGHSPGSVTFLLGEDAAFTGDFLFITSIGRPDLADRTEEWAALLWQSIERIKRSWPSDLVIYPAHYTSSTRRMRGNAIGDSFGHLREQNLSLAITDESAFVLWIKAKVATAPPAYRVIKGINVGLLQVGGPEADELETGKNECALGGSD